MLDFAALSAQMEQMLDATQGHRAPQFLALAAAREMCASTDATTLNAAILVARDSDSLPQNWHPATLFEGSELCASLSAPAAPPEHRVLATDGSQIYPDAHQISDCYLLHLSSIDLRYGENGAAQMSASPHFFYADSADDWHAAASSGASAAGRELVDARRHVMELEALAQLMESCDDVPSLGLGDGIFDLRLSAQMAWREFAQDANLGALDRLRACNQPIAGYIAASRAVDVVTALRVLRQEKHPDDDETSRALATLPDVRLFDELLEIGARSGVWKSGRLGSSTRSGAKASNEGARHETCFFYLKIDDGEVARLEFPIWVAEKPAWIEQIHSLVLAQIRCGEGYPIALMEAHEHAVVRASEREAFYLLLEELMRARGMQPRRSNKSRSKSRPLV